MKHTMRLICAALLAALLIIPAAALAAGDDFDTAGNAFFTDAITGETVSLDLYGGGETVSVNGCAVGGSAILAGKDLSFTHSAVGGSLRAAGYTVLADDTSVGANATVAAYSVNFGPAFTAKGVYGVAENITFNGVCDALSLAANSVTIGGTINGDANISAENVTVLPDAVVNGTLTVSSSKEPDVADGASVAALDFQKTEKAAAEAVTFTAKAFSFVKKLARGVLGAACLALLYYFLIRSTLIRAGEMLKERPAPLFVGGFAALVAVPLAVILLLISYVGAAAGGLIAALYTIALLFSVSFAGAAVGTKLLPKLPGLAAAVIGAAALAFVKSLPVIGGFTGFASILFTLGYFVQAAYQRLKQPAPEPNAPTLDGTAEPVDTPEPETTDSEG